MKKYVLLSCICLILLVSLVAFPAFAATVTCPPACSCLLPAEARKISAPGYCLGKQAVCGYDMLKNEKYCYENPVTTAAVPQLVITARQFVPVTTETLRLPACPAGCTCLSTADGKAKGLLYCNGRQTPCGYGTDKTPLYCFALPAMPTPVPALATGVGVRTPATTLPVVQVKTTPCPDTCTCLAADKADAAGFRKCSGSSATCDFDPLGRPMYCYAVDRVAKVSPGTTATTAILVPAARSVATVRMTVMAAESRPTPSPGPFGAIDALIALLFGGRDAAGAGAGIPKGCPEGLTACDGECADLRNDLDNCGQCGGVCYGQLPLCCDGNCSSMVSADNCGNCGNACTAGEPCTTDAGGWLNCVPGGCQGTDRSRDCGTGVCIDLLWDSSNCGSCGTACPDHAECRNGLCAPCGEGTDRCGTGGLASGGMCENIVSSPFACGGCGIVCDPGMICEGGMCTLCPAGETRCGTSCTDLQAGRPFCGSCGNTCSGSQLCVRGTCVYTYETGDCGPGQYPCGGACNDFQSDENNCGGCGTACDSRETCCNGICVDTSSDISRCGSCTNQCRYPLACREGRCLDIRSDPDNCGGAGVRCADGESCCNGHCTDIQADGDNCGACGNRCHFPGEICCRGDCVNPSSDNHNCGRCGGTCTEGRQCCSGGCYDLLWDESACGSCSRDCPWNKECQNGLCCLWGTTWGCE